jgi:hypothetical protein
MNLGRTVENQACNKWGLTFSGLQLGKQVVSWDDIVQAEAVDSDSAFNCHARGAMSVVSQARPSQSTAFIYFRINMRGEGLAHCLYPFGSTRHILSAMANQIHGKRDVNFLYPAYSEVFGK